METLSYQDQIKRKIRKARNDKNAPAMVYYRQALDWSACAGFETFSTSWAGQQWLEKNKKEIDLASRMFKGIL